MTSYLKQSTSVDVGVGPFLDETDGKTAETGLTITQPDIRLKKNGGAWAQKAAAQTLTHEEAGWYELTLDATDTNTLGILIVAIHESGALPVWKEYMVVPANVYDSIVSGSDNLQVDTIQVNGTAQTGGDLAAMITAVDDLVDTEVAAIKTDTAAILVDTNELQTDWVDGGRLDLILDARASQASVNTIDDFLDTEIAAILVAVDTEVAAILADTNELQTDWADGGRLDLILDDRASQSSLNTLDDFVDTEVAAIKAKTDQLTFTTANRVDSTAITVSDKTGYSIGTGGIATASFAAGAIDNAALAADAIGASEFSQAAAQEIADEVLNRDLAGGGSGNTRNVRNALRSLRNKAAISAGTLTVYAENDSDAAWTAAVTTAAGNPIDSIDPA